MLAYVLVSAYAWAQFPYDNVCVAENATAGVSGIYLYQDGDEIREVAVEEDVPVVFCQQSWRYFEGFPFPPTSRLQPDGLRFMTDSQETLANIYGWTAVAVTVGFVVYFFGAAITRFLLSWFRAVYKPSGQDQNIDFSSNADIYGYVPQIKKGGFAFPFLACNVDQIDPVSHTQRALNKVLPETHYAVPESHRLEGSFAPLRLSQFSKWTKTRSTCQTA